MQMVNEKKEDILVYGVGRYFEQYKNEIYIRYNVIAFVDNIKTGLMDGIKITASNDIKPLLPIKCLIMITDMREVIRIGQELHKEYGVKGEELLIGTTIFKSADDLEVTFDNDMYLKVRVLDDKYIKVASFDEYVNMLEVCKTEGYHYHIGNDRQDVVIDVGMNIGAASMYFLNSSKVKRVYGYEPFPETYKKAETNLSEYNKDANRLRIFKWGWSDRNEVRKVKYNPDLSCGMSTMSDIESFAEKNYKKLRLLNIDKDTYINVEVHKASDVVSGICGENPECNIVLKLDCEGEEYNIIRQLDESGYLKVFSLIMLEWHYKGNDNLIKILEKNRFSYICANKSYEMGLIYAYRV